ncbi:MAG: peptidyl-prolyl cis-trans isomerase [Nitrospiraceae bacterium]|nr:MAG: peptidyl-prolyl cis-trans isomerase [Nitrospiraceae bacterium]
MINNLLKLRWARYSVYFICIVSLAGCATVSQKKDIAALVDNDPVTIGDIEYSLQIAHRREGLSQTKSINIPEFVQKVIDERLLVHEAKRMNLDRDPGLIKKVDAYILRESVTRLYSDEVLTKVKVSEDEIKEYYGKEYKTYTLSYIETDSPEDAEALLHTLNAETDFSELARKFASREFRKVTVEAIHTRKDLNKELKEVIDNLSPGETSNVVEAGGRHYIVRLISRHSAPDNEFDLKKESIHETLRKTKVDQRSDEYLDHLEKKMSPEVNQELLSSIPVDPDQSERAAWLQDNRILVSLRESTLTVGEFVTMLRPGKEVSKDRIIRRWIEPKAVDYEALDRRYDMNSDLKDMVLRYKNKMLMNLFIKKELTSGVRISDQEMLDYYNDNRDEYHTPVRYKLQQITTNTMTEAEDIKRELENNADFTWLARNRSVDNYSFSGGTVGWLVKSNMPSDLKSIIEDLQPGHISDIMKSGDFYRIYRVQDKTESKVEDYDRVRPDVHRKVFAIKYGELHKTYVDKLRSEADIVINEKVLQDLDRMINSGKS